MGSEMIQEKAENRSTLLYIVYNPLQFACNTVVETEVYLKNKNK